jgi:hypothetical protein
MKKNYKKHAQLVGRKLPKQGTKARAILQALMDSHGQPISENLLSRLSGTDYIQTTVATLRDMGWAISAYTRFNGNRFGKRIGIVSYALNRIDNEIEL